MEHISLHSHTQKNIHFIIQPYRIILCNITFYIEKKNLFSYQISEWHHCLWLLCLLVLILASVDKIPNRDRLREEKYISVHHVGESPVMEEAQFLAVVCCGSFTCKYIYIHTHMLHIHFRSTG